MLKLAVNHSVISSDALVPVIHDLYDIGDIAEVRFLNNGLNDTYLVAASEIKYILRIYKVNWRSQSDIEWELELLHHLYVHGLPVSHAVMKKAGGNLVEIAAPEGQRFAALFTYAEGGHSDTKESSSLYGEEVAKLHAAMNGYQCRHDRFVIDLDHLLKEPLQSIKPLLAHRPEDFEYLEALSKLLRSRIETVSEELERGMCHGDLHGWNVHFHNDSLTHFDFDCGGFGWRAYDLAVFLWARVRGRGKDAFHNEMWDAFLASYQQHKALSKHDLEAIPAFIAIREIWLMGLHTGNAQVWGAWQNDHYFDTNLKFLREWCAEHAIA
ncbi:phosphotransferase enzyme family protein [Paenibacillus spongiae]|uniref:Phosphotransferase n=1 Tax=Paenibacillus spongiae TaxID=2909671 RepID=A0ABY5S8M9_9BACL|nr:phosphotransferase [Paenibacillus spongiae]UVI29187.1 phosphotransferase [Paenibacillus spongiae]